MPNQHLKSIRKKFSNQLGIIPIPLIIGAILVITAAAASIPVTYIINQTSQDTRSRAGICCEAGSCNDGWSYGRDENAPQATCEQRKQEACASRGGPASGGGSCSGGGGGSVTCKETAFCGGCIQADRCVYYSDGTKKYCNQWIDQECQQAGCCGYGVFCPSGQSCCPGQGLIKCPNGRCDTTCQAPTSTPTPTNTPIPSGTQCSGNQKECVNSISFKTCTNGYWSSPISCSSLNPNKPKCVDGACVSATAPDGRKTNLANCTTPCSDVDGCVCKADDCVTPQDGVITDGNICGVAAPTSCDGGIAPGNCNASGRICVVGVINNTPYASFQPPPQGKVCQGVNQPPVDAPTCVPPNNPVNPSTQQCCSGLPRLVPGWGTGYFCIETSPPPPNSPTATISPSPSPTATWTPTPSASITISPTATWTPIPTQTPPPPTVTPPASCDGGIAPGNCNASGRICVVGVINNTPYASFQPPPQGKVCQGVNQPPVSVTATATAAPSPSVTVSPTLSPTATAVPTTAGCIADGGYWYPGLTCCSGQSHNSFSGDTICGPSPTATPTPTPAVISTIQQIAQAITTTVTQVATTIWDWITGGSQTTPTPTSVPTTTPSPSPSLIPSATAAPPPPTNTPIPTATPTVTPPASCDGGIAPGNCNASGRICVVGVINNTPYASFQPPPQGKVCQGVNQPPVSVTATATAAPSPSVTVSPTPQFTLTLTQNDLMSYCIEQYGNQYSLLLTPNGYYCSYYDGQRTHQHRVDPNSICQDLTGNPSAVAVPFDNQYRCVVN